MLLEREAELEVLDAVLAGGGAGRGGLLLVEGEAGAGKTTLLSALRERAAAHGARCLAARGGQVEQRFAYGCARQLFEGELRRATHERRAVLLSGAAGHALVPLGEAAGGATEQDDAELRAMHGLHWLVVNLTDDAPLVLVLDDAHWADAATLRWAGYLARRVEALPVVIAVAARPEAEPATRALIDELVDGSRTTVLRPRPLTAGAVAALAAERLAAAPEPAFVDAALRVTRGNPFFVQELLRAAQTERLAPLGSAAAELERLGPDRVAPSVARRIHAAGPGSVALAGALAVLAGRAPVARVAAVAGLEHADALAAAATLTRAGVLDGVAELDFVHPIVRTAVRDRLDPAERVALHARAASVLAETGGDADRVAVHLHHVAPGTPLPGPASAASLLLRAAQDAAGRGEHGVAADHLRRALEEPLAPDERQVATLALARSEMQRRSRDAFALYDAALDGVADAAERAAVVRELVHGHSLHGEFREGAEVAERALGWPDLPDDARLALRAEALIGGTMQIPPTPQSLARLDELTAAARAGRTLHPMEQSVVGHGLILSGADVPLGVELCRASIYDPRVDATHGALDIAGFHGLIRANAWGELEELLEERLTGARREGSRRGILANSNLRAWLRQARGDLLGAESDVRTLFELAPADEAPSAVAWMLGAMLRVLCPRGQVGDARALLDRWQPAEPWPRVYQFGVVHQGRALLALAEGRPEAALRDALAAGELFGGAPISPEAAPWRSTAALAHLALGDGDTARTLVVEELELARAAGIAQGIGWALIAQARCGGDDGDAVHVLEQAVAVLDGSGAELALATARVDLGAALRRAGRRVDAREALRVGVDAASRCGAVPLAARGREELVAAGARPRRERLGGVEALTAAERRVVELAAAGATNREIAQALFLTQKTVETHLSSAYRKLDISSRRQLADVLAA